MCILHTILSQLLTYLRETNLMENEELTTVEKKRDFDKTLSFALGSVGILANTLGFIISVATNTDLLRDDKIGPFIAIVLPTSISLLFNVVFFLILSVKLKKYAQYSLFASIINGYTLFPFMLKGIGFLFFHYYYILAIFAGFSTKKWREGLLIIPIIFVGAVIFMIYPDTQLPIREEIKWKYIIPPTLMFTILYGFAAYMYKSYTTDRQALLDKEKELAVLAERDGLTKAFNRRMFDLDLREKKIESIIMIDIDFFKKVNDTYGHQEGDKVLKKLVALMYPLRRYEFQVYRYGGEEFCILSMYDKKATINRLQSIMNRVRNNLKVEADGTPVTISIGMSSKKTEDIEDMLYDADKINLYKAKQNGRNRAYIDGACHFSE